MNAGIRLAGFALAVLAVFGVGFGAGSAVGPLENCADQPTQPHGMPDTEVSR